MPQMEWIHLRELLDYRRICEKLPCFSSYRCCSSCSAESSKWSKETGKAFKVQFLILSGTYMINNLNIMLTTLPWWPQYTFCLCQKALNNLSKTPCGRLHIPWISCSHLYSSFLPEKRSHREHWQFCFLQRKGVIIQGIRPSNSFISQKTTNSLLWCC